MNKKTISFFILLTAFSSITAQSRIGFNAKGGFAFPVGDFAELYNIGFGGNAGMFYDVEDNIRLAFSFGYTAWSLDNSALNEKANADGLKGKFDVTDPVYVLPILVQVKFFLSGKEFNPYLLLEGGLYQYKREVSGIYTENGVVTKIKPKSDSDSQTGLNFGLGAEFPLEENILLDVSARYHLVTTAEYYNFADNGSQTVLSTSKYISVMAGISVYL